MLTKDTMQNLPNRLFNTLTIEQTKPKTLIYSSLLLLSVFLPSIIHQQAITGPLINAILLLATVTLGTSAALTIGLIPSVVALSRGLLPAVLAPVVPFIMLANAVYVLVFYSLQRKNYVGAVVTASLSKFGLLYLVSQHLLATLLPQQFLSKAAAMMSWPQLVTALTGGVIAWVVLKGFGGNFGAPAKNL